MRFSIGKMLGQMNLLKAIVLLVIIVFFVAAASITITAQSGFCNSCHIMNDYYASWEESSHHDVACLDCHIQPGAGHYLKGKINGLSQAVDCMVGRVGTKPETVVPDVTCLRSTCHTSQELDNDDISFNGTKFTHKGHVGQIINGITVSCGTCHNHYEGNEHFSVRNDACFTCHFLTSDAEGVNPSKVGCLDCHDVPENVIDKGYVKINHKEFATYQTNCGESCHKKQVSVESKVDKNTCLACHTYSLSDKWTVEELHHTHTAGEKIECFACHGETEHGMSGASTSSMTDMFECQNCHSDTHTVQQSVFGASEHPMMGSNDEKILGSMYLTHVECSDCHIERTEVRQGTVNSFGTVAKAVPEACDVCHGAGSGEKYISLWQSEAKKLFDKVSARLAMYKMTADMESANAKEIVSKASSILESVEADGSWGVHNHKYTEALLNQANELINKGQE